MNGPILHKYVDGGASFANLALPSGERLFLSIAKSGFAIRRLHLGGRIPGRRLFAADAAAVERMRCVLARDSSLPPLPQATELHRDEGAMASFLDAALADLGALKDGHAVPGAVDDFDPDDPPLRPLAAFTRLALTASDVDDCARLFERAKNTPA